MLSRFHPAAERLSHGSKQLLRYAADVAKPLDGSCFFDRDIPVMDRLRGQQACFAGLVPLAEAQAHFQGPEIMTSVYAIEITLDNLINCYDKSGSLNSDVVEKALQMTAEDARLNGYTTFSRLPREKGSRPGSWRSLVGNPSLIEFQQKNYPSMCIPTTIGLLETGFNFQELIPNGEPPHKPCTILSIIPKALESNMEIIQACENFQKSYVQNTFSEKIHVGFLSPGLILLRLIGKGSNVPGPFWMPLSELKFTVPEIRQSLALSPFWNQNGALLLMVVPENCPLIAFDGPAATQDLVPRFSTPDVNDLEDCHVYGKEPDIVSKVVEQQTQLGRVVWPIPTQVRDFDNNSIENAVRLCRNEGTFNDTYRLKGGGIQVFIGDLGPQFYPCVAAVTNTGMKQFFTFPRQ